VEPDVTVPVPETDTTDTVPVTPTVPLPPMIGEALDAACPTPVIGEPLHPGTLMRRVTLSGAGRCNDGTSPFLYVLPASDPDHADDWVWFFDGGAFCGGNLDCKIRWCGEQLPFGKRHMSSDPLPGRIGGEGITSQLLENTFAGWNLVFAAYCTSDSWSGTRADVVLEGDVPYRVHFEGALVGKDGIAAGVAGLVSDDGELAMPKLGDAARVLAVGTSAGCQGAVRNTDDLAAAAPGAVVTTVLDSCFAPAPGALGPYEAPWSEQVDRFQADVAVPLWGAEPEPACAAAHPEDPGVCADMGLMIRDHLPRVVWHHDLDDPVIYQFYQEAGLSKAQFAQAAIDTFREYAITQPHVAIHSNNCGVHTTIDGNGTFLNYTVADAVAGGPAWSLHDALADALDGGRPVAIDSSPSTTSVCGIPTR
jgi:Pectinacetylesterase